MKFLSSVLWFIAAMFYLFLATCDLHEYITGKRRTTAALFFGSFFMMVAVKIFMNL